MSTKMFVNLPVKDLNRTKEFFSLLGFTYNPQFTDENAACMIIGEDNYVMLITHDFFKNFTPKEISDSPRTTEVIVSLTVESRAKVDEMINMAIDAGGKLSPFSQDLNWMYDRGFSDLDGHLWEFFYMDVNAIPDNQSLSSN